jgi:superfamily II DNA or RNA helicase
MDSAYIPNMSMIRAGFQWFISATFEEVLTTVRRSRRIHHLKHLFMNILSDEYDKSRLLETITVRSTEALRNLRPIPMEYESKFYDVNRAPVVDLLGGYMEHNLIEMIDAGNIKDAIKHLGGDEEETNIADLLRRRANSELAEAKRKVDEYKGKLKEEWIRRLESAKRKVSDIEEKILSIETDNCPLCSVEMKHPVLLGCCQHLVCARCLATWIRQRNVCPFCIRENPKLTYIKGKDPKVDGKDEEKKEEIKPVPQTKFDHMLNISVPGRKVLLFASHDDQFSEISNALKTHGISYGMLSGTVTRRASILEGFTKGDIRVLILNSRVNGAGLNLQVSTDIIMWHSMSAPLTKQLIGRALRYGLDHKLTVHKFFSREEDGKGIEPQQRGCDAEE